MSPPPSESVVFATTADGARLALTHLPAPSSTLPPVLLSHGAFSNSRLCLRFAGFLRERGFDCWVLDWRGHGRSGPQAPPADYEQLALHEVDTAQRLVREHTGAESLFWVGHSAGGVLPFIYLARHPRQARHFRGLVSLGSQATHFGSTLKGRLLLGLCQGLTLALGRGPGRLLRMGPEDEAAPLMRQWLGWNLRGRWVGRDGLDYLQALGALDVPLLCLSGGADTLIAPRQGCRALFEALGGSRKTYLHCARSEGFGQDFAHGELIAGAAAQRELWPRLERWLREHAEASPLSHAG